MGPCPMSITGESVLPPLPAATRATGTHLSFDKRSGRLAYASGKAVYLRSVDNPFDCVQYTAHTATTTVAKFAPSGMYVASADVNGHVHVWDCVGEDMVTKGDYQVISGRVNDLAWDGDSQRLIAVGDGKERYGHCFTSDSGNTVGEISGHSEIINAVTIRPVRPYRAATVSDDASLVFYHGPPFKFELSARSHHTTFVSDVGFSPDGSALLSVGMDRKIVLYDGKTGAFVSFVDNDHTGGILGVAWHADSKHFATASADGSVKYWDFDGTKATSVRTWASDSSLPNQKVGVVFANDMLISLSLNGTLIYYDVTKDTPLRKVYGHQQSILGMARVDDKLFTGGADGTVLEITNDSINPVPTGHSGLVCAVKKVKASVYTLGWDDTMRQIDAESRKTISSIPLLGQPKAVDGCGRNIVVATAKGVNLIEEGKTVASLSDDTVTAVSIVDSYVAVGTARNAVDLYDLSLTKVASFPPLLAACSSLLFSGDAKYLAAGDVSGKIVLYDVESRSVVTTRWAFHTSRITSLHWHESKEYLVSGSLDSSIIVYSVAKPTKNVKKLNAHKDGVNAVVWTSKDTLASAGNDGAIRRWKVVFKD